MVLMQWQEVKEALEAIAAPDQGELAAGEIRASLRKIQQVLQAETGFKDLPPGTPVRPVPYELVSVQESIERALADIDSGKTEPMLENVRKAKAAFAAIKGLA